jgi:hypothetical protein
MPLPRCAQARRHFCILRGPTPTRRKRRWSVSCWHCVRSPDAAARGSCDILMLTRSTSSALIATGSSGLTGCRSKPAPLLRSRSSFWPRPVPATIAIDAPSPVRASACRFRICPGAACRYRAERSRAGTHRQPATMRCHRGRLAFRDQVRLLSRASVFAESTLSSAIRMRRRWPKVGGSGSAKACGLASIATDARGKRT